MSITYYKNQILQEMKAAPVKSLEIFAQRNLFCFPVCPRPVLLIARSWLVFVESWGKGDDELMAMAACLDRLLEKMAEGVSIHDPNKVSSVLAL